MPVRKQRRRERDNPHNRRRRLAPTPGISVEEYRDAESEAQRQLDERDRYDRAREAIRVRRNAIAAVYREEMRRPEFAIAVERGGRLDGRDKKIVIVRTHAYNAIDNGSRAPDALERYHFLNALSREIARRDELMRALDRDVGVRAFVEEDLERATFRVLLERGAKPEHIARACNRSVADQDLAGTAEAGAAKRIRSIMLAWYTARCDRLRAQHDDGYRNAKSEEEFVRCERIVRALTPRAYTKKPATV